MPSCIHRRGLRLLCPATPLSPSPCLYSKRAGTAKRVSTIETDRQRQHRNEEAAKLTDPAKVEPAAIEAWAPLDERIPKTLSKKSYSPTPSDLLVAALQAANLRHLIAAPPSDRLRRDLSHVDPYRYDSSKRQACLTEAQGDKSPLKHLHVARPSLQAIVARQVLAWRENPGKLKIFGPQLNQKEQLYLAKRGYNRDHLAIWVKILTEEDSDLAARTLRTGMSIGIGNGEFMDQPIPAFLPLALLRRPHLSPTALRDIITRLWSELRRSERMPHIRITLTSMPMFIILVRLLRRAKETWPAALVTVAQMFLHYFNTSHADGHIANPTHRPDLERQTYLYNKMLSLLAPPAQPAPYASIPFQQRAQFDIVAVMANKDPPLQLSREGFRAMVSVQLAHRKTSQEQDWSQLKAKSWPPFKEDKTGLDADKDQEYGTSRAMQVLRRAAEAGYARDLWEKNASILAGWDVDRSPTIQTRALMLHRYLSLNRPLTYWHEDPSLTRHHSSTDHWLWARRIEATRTKREAWACFLSYQDTTVVEAGRPDRGPYDAMLRKLLAAEVDPDEIRPDDSGSRRSLEPGDGKEIFPEPVSPKETTWIHTPVPKITEFLQDMSRFNIRMRARTLAELLQTAEGLRQGLNFMYLAATQDTRLRCLLDTTTIDRSGLGNVPDVVFASFLGLLCRFGSTVRSFELGEKSFLWHPSQPALRYALELLKARPGRKFQALHTILHALDTNDRNIAGIDEGLPNQPLSPLGRIRRFQFLQDVKGLSHEFSNRMYLRMNERAILSVLQLQKTQPGDKKPSVEGISNSAVKKLLETNADKVKRSFYAIHDNAAHDDTKAGSEGTEAAPLAMPALTSIPTAQTLHSLVRILGFLRDFRGIVDLFEWTQQHQQTLGAAFDEPRNAREMFRRAVVAARVCFERSWARNEETGEMSRLAAPEDVQVALETLIDEHDFFGGWPNDVEVAMYVDKGEKNFPPDDEGSRDFK